MGKNKKQKQNVKDSKQKPEENKKGHEVSIGTDSSDM